MIGKPKNKHNFPDELTFEQEDELEKNLVWILSFSRSGTQWLGTQLLEYNTIICHGPSIGINLGAIHSGFEDKIVRIIEFRGDEPDYFLSKKYKHVWMHYLRKLILNRLYAQYQTLSKKIVIPDPEGSIAADIIAECTPNSKIIILIRDGRDVVDSIIDAAKPGSWHIKSRGVTPLTSVTREKRIKHASTRWVRQIEFLQEAYSTHSEELRLDVRYEKLREDTFNELEKIYKFMGIDISSEEIEKIIEKYSFEKIPEDQKGPGKVRRSASPGKWKVNFSEEEQKIMNEIMGDALKSLGYEVQQNPS